MDRLHWKSTECIDGITASRRDSDRVFYFGTVFRVPRWAYGDDELMALYLPPNECLRRHDLPGLTPIIDGTVEITAMLDVEDPEYVIVIWRAPYLSDEPPGPDRRYDLTKLRPPE